MISGRYSRFKNAYIWWVAIFFIIVLVSFKYPVGQQFQLAIAPLLHVVQAPVRWYQSFSLWFEDSSELQARYNILHLSHDKQQALAQQTEALRVENKQLRTLLNIKQLQSYHWRVARVISRGPESKSRSLMLEIDQAQGDDVIVSREGLVGLVDESSTTYAVVRTILDASVTVPVTMFESDLAALVRGDGEHLRVDFVPMRKAPKIDDVLVTSGAGGVFPAGLPVAKVTQVKAIDGGVFAEVLASPVASWQRDAWLAIVAKSNVVREE
ncbi:MAG TPA: rod shape-determining protein MreC [Mariprofundaceae bacterium]|nr:rod shape-determining protein MreC [Mariprofundaceae bacterium]